VSLTFQHFGIPISFRYYSESPTKPGPLQIQAVQSGQTWGLGKTVKTLGRRQELPVLLHPEYQLAVAE
jgi:hypothetical protein